MAKPVLAVLLALCLLVSGVALAKVVITAASSSGAAVSSSAGKELRSSVGRPIATVMLREAAEQEAPGFPGRQGMPVSPDSGDALVPGLRPGFPNPFHPETTIVYAVGERARVFLGVYDVSGRLVRTLVDDVRDCGRIHEVCWDGTSGSGDGLPSGVYFVRITTDRFSETQKVMLLR